MWEFVEILEKRRDGAGNFVIKFLIQRNGEQESNFLKFRLDTRTNAQIRTIALEWLAKKNAGQI